MLASNANIGRPPEIGVTSVVRSFICTMAPAGAISLGILIEKLTTAAGVPAAAALAVANRVGPRAHEEWSANHARASAALVAALRAHGVL
jgi:purine-nucleoside phosphorylase